MSFTKINATPAQEREITADSLAEKCAEYVKVNAIAVVVGKTTDREAKAYWDRKEEEALAVVVKYAQFLVDSDKKCRQVQHEQEA